MEQGTFDFSDEAPPASVKLCECGCGLPAPLAKKNVERLGHVKGQPIRFIHGHNGSKVRGSEPRLFVYVGQRFGQGVVIDPKVPFVLPSGRVLRGAKLRCDCGDEYDAEIADVVSGRKLSCGCRRTNVIDRTGQRYGRLVVLHRVKNKRPGGTLWLCRCDCGEEVEISAGGLSGGTSTSCGPCRRGPAKGFLPGQAALNGVFAGYRRGARERGLPWKLTKEAFYRITALNCYYCGAPPGAVARSGLYNGRCLYNGIDRMDNSRGYVTGNCVPCCKICNHAKGSMPYDQFMAWIARLAEYRRFHPEPPPPPRLLKVKGAKLEARFG